MPSVLNDRRSYSPAVRPKKKATKRRLGEPKPFKRAQRDPEWGDPGEDWHHVHDAMENDQ